MASRDILMNKNALCCGLFVLAAILIAFPAIDIGFSRLFFSGREFIWRYHPALEFIRKDLPAFGVGVGVILVLLGLANLAFKRNWLGITPRVMLYLAGSAALGPGLLANWLFKENWGRARPSQIVEFGGKAQFTPPLVMANQCLENCSFVSGHAATAFWAVALAFLVPWPWRRWAIVAAVLFGSIVGMTRIAQGGHFLSDVFFAALITTGSALLCRRYILGRE
jgi:lipid A 4'-phosphatase